MHIELGAHVWTQEGKVAGKVSKLVVDTDAQTLDSFVVHTQWMGQDMIVPIASVERVDADDTIHLAITEEHFRELPQYFSTAFVTSDPSEMEGVMYNEETAVRGMLPLSSPGLGAPTSMGQQYDPSSSPLIGITDMNSSVVTTESSLSDTEFGITKGTVIETVDGHHVGNVHELSVTDDGKLRGLIVTSGHIIKHQRFIPMEEVADADSSAVYVRMSASDFHHLAQTEQPENEQQSGQP